MDHIKKSVSLVNRYLIYILLIGITGIKAFPASVMYLTYIGLFISLVLEVILLGKLSFTITKTNIPSAAIILKEKWFNYFIITVLVAVPVIIFNLVSNLFSLNTAYLLFIKLFIIFITAALSIYVLPIAYMKNENIKSLIVGIYYLLTNLKYSIPILGILVAVHFSSFSPALILMQYNTLGIYGIMPIMMLFNTISVYLSAVIFSAATLSLTQKQYESA